ncbi:MarR family winged helix-turn-helix transcriptional regulator [Streptacidiphilus sp. N1-10]|uniref:MarR family winged helix-turn-helix transcriptional regulator n=1 Tax=Streptacidiphilus jeojiensis TaxID=3229225 RepID=A0ABV6Y112_9ACTN
MDANSHPDTEEQPSATDVVGLLLRRAHRRAAREFSRQLQPLGIDNRHAGVLLQLARDEPVTQRDLIALLGSDKSTMVRNIDELEARGLAVRRPHPTDRRAHAIRPTEAGLAVLAEVRSRAEAANDNLLTCLQPDERAQLLHLLRRFADAEERSPDDLS